MSGTLTRENGGCLIAAGDNVGVSRNGGAARRGPAVDGLDEPIWLHLEHDDGC